MIFDKSSHFQNIIILKFDRKCIINQDFFVYHSQFFQKINHFIHQFKLFTIQENYLASNQMSNQQQTLLIQQLQKSNVQLTQKCNIFQKKYNLQLQNVQILKLELKQLDRIHSMCQKNENSKQCQNCINLKKEFLENLNNLIQIKSKLTDESIQKQKKIETLEQKIQKLSSQLNQEKLKRVQTLQKMIKQQQKNQQKIIKDQQKYQELSNKYFELQGNYFQLSRRSQQSQKQKQQIQQKLLQIQNEKQSSQKSQDLLLQQKRHSDDIKQLLENNSKIIIDGLRKQVQGLKKDIFLRQQQKKKLQVNNNTISQLKKNIEILTKDLKQKEYEVQKMKQQLKLKEELINYTRKENIALKIQIQELNKKLGIQPEVQDWTVSLLNQSSILNQQQVQLLQSWLLKPISKIEHKFKASENNYKLNKFFQICGDLQNIIIVAKTKKDKIVGGFTPLTFNTPSNRQTNDGDLEKIKDESNQSFVFSLSEKQKFELKKDNYAIKRWKDKSYVEFYNTFYISDNSNKYVYNNWFRLDRNAYETSKYPATKQSYLKITGQESQDFLVAQWEVYQVFF